MLEWLQERERVQDMFSKGQLKCVVATVAFGMGVDAASVQGVCHLSLPQSLEEFVQQVQNRTDNKESFGSSKYACRLRVGNGPTRFVSHLARQIYLVAPAPCCQQMKIGSYGSQKRHWSILPICLAGRREISSFAAHLIPGTLLPSSLLL